MSWQCSRNITHLITVRKPCTNVTKTFPVSWDVILQGLKTTVVSELFRLVIEFKVTAIFSTTAP